MEFNAQRRVDASEKTARSTKHQPCLHRKLRIAAVEALLVINSEHIDSQRSGMGEKLKKFSGTLIGIGWQVQET